MGDRILVLNGFSYASPIADLGDVSYSGADLVCHPDEFKLVMFTGGSDVDPSYYGETSPHRMCGSNLRRDAQEKHIFDFAVRHDIMMTGICRGIQFLNVMAGGRLMHHIDGHAGSTHNMTLATGEVIRVNSLHHQMVIPSEHSIITGWSTNPLSRGTYHGHLDLKVEYDGLEVESAILPGIKAFGVQYHPEMMAEDSDGCIYYRNMVKDALALEWEEFITKHTEGQYADKRTEVCERVGPVGG